MLSAARESEPTGGQLDRSVVEALYEEHGNELRRLLLGVLRDHQLVADCLQSAFAKLITQGHNSREESRKAWLFRVAYHEALAFLRRRNTGERVVRRLAWSIDLVDESVESGLLRAETVAAVRQVIETLPPDQREVVRLRIYEEQTFSQIAVTLQIPLGTALGRMRAAMEKMRRRLAEPT
jgi:RNA polymerase sigma-70 factor (ECF subfamily)